VTLHRRPKKIGTFLAITLLFAVWTLTTKGDAGKAEDPTGAWKLKCVSPDGKPRECVVTLYREGEDLKGNLTIGRVTQAAKNVGFHQGVLSFRVDGEFAGKAYTLAYQGKPQGDQLRGTVRWTYGWASGSFGFEGERLPRKVALRIASESAR
jgi:hypothetical protein